MIHHRHSLVRESIVTGFLGALVVAVFFFVIDLLHGQPLATPSVLGQVILFHVRDPLVNVIDPAAVVGYTVLHFSAFILIGIIATWLVHVAIHNPLVRLALLMLVVAFEGFFAGITLMFSEATRQLFPLWSVLAANLLAAGVMGGYLWRHHPALKRAIDRLPLGAGE
ncbi:MAG: hypothetical protein ACREL2_02235 [Gemmatimonadales bacterium]